MVAANDSTRTTIGKVEVNFKVGGCVLTDDFHVIEQLTRDVILHGGRVLRTNGRVVGLYKHKGLVIYNGAINVPLLTAIYPTRAVCTSQKIRMPGTRP